MKKRVKKKRIKRKKAYRLEDLLAKITPENRHGEISTGKPVGRESW